MIAAQINWFELWQNSWPAGVTMLVLGLGFAVVLLIASEKLKVVQDERIERVAAALPNINCGACGFAGCQDYAKMVVADATLLGRCFPGGSKTMGKIAEILNLQISNSHSPKRPIVHCRANKDDKTIFAKYEGVPTCTAENALANVQACKFGCLGFGDCKASCKFSAINIVNGLASINYEKCTGCGACSKACPRNLIEMVPFTHNVMMTVACKSQENGKDTRAFCKVGCIACKLCTKQTDAFEMTGNLAKMNYDKYQPGEAFETAKKKCPTGVIVYRGKNAPA
jgi:RnfABCDGE-type electron transport complex B subunit